MEFAARLPQVRYHGEHFNKRTGMCYHQAPPLVRVVAHVEDARQAEPHSEHNPLSRFGTCPATPIQKLNDPGYRREHVDERTGMCYHQAPPLERVVVHVRDAGQAKPHLEHNPLSLRGAC